MADRSAQERELEEHASKVRRFYDRESERYVSQRYGVQEPRVARPYLERLRLIQEMLDVRDCSVLDLGCGPGILEPYLLSLGCRVFAVDLSEKMIAKARQATATLPDSAHAHFCVASAEALPFESGSFDAVTCIGVVSYWPDPARGLAEIARVLKPGGVVIVQASNPLAPREIEERLVRKPYRWLRTILTGRDCREADFSLHPHPPWRLEMLLRAAGLRPQVLRSYDFHLRLLDRLSEAFSHRIETFLTRFNRSRSIGLLGAGYLIRAVRSGEGRIGTEGP